MLHRLLLQVSIPLSSVLRIKCLDQWQMAKCNCVGTATKTSMNKKEKDSNGILIYSPQDTMKSN